jgi:hypothetical protein
LIEKKKNCQPRHKNSHLKSHDNKVYFLMASIKNDHAQELIHPHSMDAHVHNDHTYEDKKSDLLLKDQ